MFKSAFSGFSVSDLEKAKAFYEDILGLKVEMQYMSDDQEMGLILHLPGGGKVFVYPKNDHTPATYTVLNLVVESIDEAVENLSEKGVTFEKYKGMPHDEKGILRGLSNDMGPDIAWFKDPSNNIFSVLQEK